MTYQVEYTDTFVGEANYSWVRRASVDMPELTHYGANRVYQRELMRRAKAAVGLTGARGVRSDYGDGFEFRPYGSATVMFVSWSD